MPPDYLLRKNNYFSSCSSRGGFQIGLAILSFAYPSWGVRRLSLSDDGIIIADGGEIDGILEVGSP
jgi:hypothetical protein